MEYEKSNLHITKKILGGVSIQSAVAAYIPPIMYKRNSDGDTLDLKGMGDEYYDDAVPYEGIYANYIEEIIKISNGDIKNVTYTHGSRASRVIHPKSMYTATVQDVADGLVDMAVGPL